MDREPQLASNADITTEEVDLTSLTDNEEEMKTAMEILGTVTDLEAYRTEVEKQIAELERDAAPAYLAEAAEFERLALELDKCDATLALFETQLAAFQEQLCSINSDIRALQDASVRSNKRVDNRLAVYERLSGALGDLEVPARLVERVRSGRFDARDTKLFAELNARSAFHEASTAAASAEARPLLAELRGLAAARIHDELVRELTAATASGSGAGACPDIAVLQGTQRELLQSGAGAAYQFLFKHAPERAADVREQYAAAAAQFYESFCARYAGALAKHAIDAADTPRKSDTLGAPEGRRVAPRLALGFFASTERTRSAHAARGVNVFALGNRYQVLARIDEPAMAVPAADAPQRYSFEVLWRSMVRVVLDLALSEAPFLRDFFLAPSKLAEDVFAPASAKLAELLEARVAASFDAIGVAIMLCITEKFNEVALRSDVACLQRFCGRCSRVLARRFDALMEHHIASLRAATPASLAMATAPAAAPHFVTRRYAEFVSALLTLAGPGIVSARTPPQQDEDEQKEWLLSGGQPLETAYSVVSRKMPLLRDEMESLLHRLCAGLQDRDKQSAFLINNYSLVLDILEEHGLASDDDDDDDDSNGASAAAATTKKTKKSSALVGKSDDTKHFRALLQAAVQAFRDSQLITVPVFKRLVLFAAESDPKQRENPENLAREFAGSWESGVQRLRATVLECFADFRVAKRIYDSFTEHVVQQYLVLAGVIRASPLLAESCTAYLVDEATLRDGIQRYGGVLEAGVIPSR